MSRNLRERIDGMRDRWARLYQDYQDGRDFTGRTVFGATARMAAVGYGLGYRLQRWFHAREPANVYRPRARVIGVGNLTVGGSGKTSLVHYIASRLIRSGREVVILTRGYGRRSKERITIDRGQARKFDVDIVGDEPLMLARQLPEAVVIVDADRAAAAADFERQFSTNVFLLDDALQYRQLVYDSRILTMLPGDLQPPYRLVPAGRWREPPQEAARADAVVLVENPGNHNRQSDEDRLARFGFAGPVFRLAYELVSWRNLDGSPAGFLTLPEDNSAGAFCALARPDRFFSWLEARNITLSRTRRFADHYRYRPQDLASLSAEARESSLDFLITTEKDAVKLARCGPPNMRIIYPEVKLTPRAGADAFDSYLESIIGHRTNN